MEKKLFWLLALPLTVLLPAACEKTETTGKKPEEKKELVSLSDAARMFAQLPLETAHIGEVRDAVRASADNGYDEEYLMKDILESPGSGVGDSRLGTKSESRYERPLGDLIRDWLQRKKGTKSDGAPADIQEYLDAMTDGGMQVYWPYAEQWNGNSYPVITYDPEDGTGINTGWIIHEDENGTRTTEEVVVTEEMARIRPVWVLNRNDDSGHLTLDMLRKLDPDWGQGGGIGPASTKSGEEGKVRTLILNSFTMNKQYDSWFAGASEFFIKCGAVEHFTARTEAEMKIYTPSVTDLMLVVRRNELGKELDCQTVLVSEWTEQLQSCAFMIVEDDGGTKTEWKASAVVKFNSKTYGLELSLPMNQYDDIVWRGQLSSRYLEMYSGVPGHFGNVDLEFELKER